MYTFAFFESSIAARSFPTPVLAPLTKYTLPSRSGQSLSVKSGLGGNICVQRDENAGSGAILSGRL